MRSAFVFTLANLTIQLSKIEGFGSPRPVDVVANHRRGNPPEAVDAPTTLFGGGKRIRTADPLLAKQVLFQLSYTPRA
jgi:hypothetical protein